MNLDDLPKEDANTDTDAEAKTDSDTVTTVNSLYKSTFSSAWRKGG